MELSQREHILIVVFSFVIMTAVILTVGIPSITKDEEYLIKKTFISSLNPIDKKPDYVPPKKLENPPEIVKAIYITSYSASSQRYIKYLDGLLNTTEINAIVVDIKPSNGYVSYKSGAPEVVKYNLSNDLIKDIDQFVEYFHEKNIYLIGRIAVFEDPMYATARPDLAIYNKLEVANGNKLLWEDNNGLYWLDPASREVWDYNISLAKDAFYHGFDEINFDYIRFPSDGNLKTMGFPIYDGQKKESDVIGEFFVYLREQLKGEKISADLFGQTTINKDDMGIGQLIENAFPNFDFLAPMIYPSHYADGFLGFENPADYPYDIVKYSMDSGLAREKAYLSSLNLKKQNIAEDYENDSGGSMELNNPIVEMASLSKFRPWLQDFDINADYTADMIRAEIKAVKDALGDNYRGFMLWSPTNIYTIGAILKTE